MANTFPRISEEQRVRRLAPPDGKINLVMDTDAFNEIDDQFAIAYALLSKDKICLQALYAAPFFNELSEGPGDGMEKSYHEIRRILELMGENAEGRVFRGSERYLSALDAPVESDAARDLIARAMAAPDDEPLYVAAIGAITNIASAILLEPEIIRKIVVVWLGGHSLHWNDTNEFNLAQDVLAAQVLFGCGVPLMLIPVMGVSSHLITTLSEIEAHVRGRGRIGDFLADRYRSCSSDHFGYSRVIWDISTIAYLLNPASVEAEWVHSPIVTGERTWSRDTSRHLIRCAKFIHRDLVLKDLFRKLETNKS